MAFKVQSAVLPPQIFLSVFGPSVCAAVALMHRGRIGCMGYLENNYMNNLCVFCVCFMYILCVYGPSACNKTDDDDDDN